ncbi:MAG: hypothetical protein MUO97_07675 [Dehalococcoidia bacterium]|nr:hypothetical protein [Dehalococcoidia bacterium]
MGLRDRLRKMRISQGAEVPISQQNVLRTKDGEQRVIVRTKCPEITNLSEIKSCQEILSILNSVSIPVGMLKGKVKDGMSQPIKKLLSAGETKDSVFAFYWSISEFKQVWGKLGLKEQDFKEVIEKS